MEFFLSVLWVIGIDLVLAGDNAIVIALAARRLPHSQQNKAIVWGTVGAVAVRMAAALVVVWLLSIPGLHLIGGLLLVWIAYNLLVDEDGHKNLEAKNTLAGAIGTIIVADAAMGIDNVVAIAGAAGENVLVIMIGLICSVPVIMFGSKLFIAWTERYPWLLYIGAGVLALTAGKMISNEAFLETFFDEYPIVKWLLFVLLIVVVVIAGKWMNDRG